MVIKKYISQDRHKWNEFNRNSKNGHFMFDRNFMEYHSDRFDDHSLMFYLRDSLVAILPGNISGSVLYSHQGLSFGGFITDTSMNTVNMISLFEELKNYCRRNKITEIVYKCIPFIYHLYPAQEDLYVMFLNNADLLKTEPSSVIYLQKPLKFAKGKKCGISKAKKAGLSLSPSCDFKTFFDIEIEILKKYNTKPVHSYEQMQLLHSRFPENIKLYGVFEQELMIAGTILFITDSVVHTQYIASTENGRLKGALEYLMHHLIFEQYTSKQFFDFGISSENNGKLLNNGLISNKELMGARTVIFQTYKLNCDDKIS